MHEKPRRVLILGGYGNAGLAIASLLLQETDVQVILAGRSEHDGRRAADRLNRRCPQKRVAAVRTDAADLTLLTKTLQGVDLVVVASSTLDFAKNVVTAAIRSRVDYLDVQLSSPAKHALLRKHERDILDAGLWFVTDAGIHPGMPAALVRYAAAVLGNVESAEVSALLNIDWARLDIAAPTMAEFAAELAEFKPVVLRDGHLKKLKSWAYPRVDFGEPYAKRWCAPMFMEELRDLPQQWPTLRDLGFFVAGFNPVTDNIVLPLAVVGLKLAPRATASIGKIFHWSLKRFGKPPFGTVLQLRARRAGQEEPQELRMQLSHEDGYHFTAAPAVACILQYLDGTIRKPGLDLQAHIVEPVRFLQDLEKMGIAISREEAN